MRLLLYYRSTPIVASGVFYLFEFVLPRTTKIVKGPTRRSPTMSTMSTRNTTRRHMHRIRTNGSSIVGDQREPENRTNRTIAWEEAEEWQRDNPYIRYGYRPGTASFTGLLKSMTMLHNETFNVYSHFIGALFVPFLAFTYMQLLSDTRIVAATKADYFMFGNIFHPHTPWCLPVWNTTDATQLGLAMVYVRVGALRWIRQLVCSKIVF